MGNTEGHIFKGTFLFADKKWFGQLYENHWERLFAICYRHVKSQETAEEIVQEVFKSLWERRHDLKINGPVEHYLARAVKLKVLEHIRTKALHEKHQDCILAEHCHALESTEHDVLHSLLAQKVARLVEHLPCQCRRVFQMSREQGLSNKEIASALLISEKAVEYHIGKALSFFRKNLAEVQK